MESICQIETQVKHETWFFKLIASVCFGLNTYSTFLVQNGVIFSKI